RRPAGSSRRPAASPSPTSPGPAPPSAAVVGPAALFSHRLGMALVPGHDVDLVAFDLAAEGDLGLPKDHPLSQRRRHPLGVVGVPQDVDEHGGRLHAVSNRGSQVLPGSIVGSKADRRTYLPETADEPPLFVDRIFGGAGCRYEASIGGPLKTERKHTSSRT